MSETEPTDQEMWNAFLKRSKEQDAKIESQNKEIEQLKEAIKKNAQIKEEADKRIVGYCTVCGHFITAADVDQPVCPYCHDGKTIRNTPIG